MTQPNQSDRLVALASHLLDGFLQLRERFALLKPMLFDRELVDRRGSGKQARGYLALRHSLFLTCAQDIAKFAMDTDKRTPSIRVIVSALNDNPTLLETFKERYAVWEPPILEDESDPATLDALSRMEAKEEAARRVQFDERWQDLKAAWHALNSDLAVTAFRTIRDKITAHTEIHYGADKYAPVDISTLGIKWSDLENTIVTMQHAVELIGLIVRNAGFAWDHLDRLLSEASDGFWSS